MIMKFYKVGGVSFFLLEKCCDFIFQGFKGIFTLIGLFLYLLVS